MTNTTVEGVGSLQQPYRGATDLADFIEQAPMGAQAVSVDGKILWANQALLSLLGYGAGEYIGRELSAFHADQRTVADILARLARHETLRNYEAALLAKDGSILHVLIDSNVRWRKGRFQYTRCFVRDVTERRRLENEVRENRRALELLSASSRDLAEAGFDLPRIFEVVCRRLANEVGDACVIRLLSEDGGWLGVQAAHHRDPDVDARLQHTIAEATPAGEGLSGEAIRTGALTLSQDLESPAAMAVPLSAEGRAFGTIAVARHALGRPYTSWERELLGEIAARASLAIFAARQHLELVVERSKYQQESQRLAAVLRQIPSGVMLVDAAGSLLMINEKAQAMFREDFELEVDIHAYGAGPNRFHTQAADGRELEPSEWPVFRSIAAGEVVTGEEVFVRRPDGRRLTIRCSSAPVRNRAGDIVAGILICDDITAEKQADEALRTSEARLQAILDGSSAVIYLKDLEGRVILVNRQLEALVGLPRSEILGQSAVEMLCGHSFAAQDRAEDLEVLRREEVRQFEHTVHFGGERRHFLTAKFPVRDAGGRIYAIGGVSTDITRRRRTEDQLKVHSQALQSMTEGVCLADDRGLIQFTNAAEDAMFGYQRGELVGKHMSVLSSSQSVDDPELALRSAQLRERGAWSGELHKTRKDGTSFVTRGHITAIEIQGRTHWLLVHEDITDEKRSEAEREALIEELQRAVHFSDMFVGILGHDLRNPLAAILMTAQLLAKTAKDDPTRASLRRILGSGRRMSRMIEQLLDLTRVRLGRGFPVDPVPLDLAKLCQAAADELATQGEGARIRIDVRGETRGRWDLDRLAQLVSNLLGNATQYRTPGTPVRVTIDGRVDAEVILRVHNQGHIAAAKLPLLFEPFKERDLEESSSGGLGLGLSISQQIARAHGGNIQVSSSAETGTTFEVRLPRESQAAQVGPRAAAEAGHDPPAPVASPTQPEEPPAS